jgi:hypothetical protein
MMSKDKTSVAIGMASSRDRKIGGAYIILVVADFY